MKPYEIIHREQIAERVKVFVVYAPLITKHCQPGQFLIVMVHENGERIPLTIADFDRERGTVEIVFQEIGKSTVQLGAMEAGECLHAIVGPLGHASEITGWKRVVAVGGGIGVAPVFPIARGCKQNGARVTSIIGARTRELLIYEEKMRGISDELIVCTDDGSYGRQAMVTEPLREMLEKEEKIDLCVAIGPAIMMKSVAETTRPFGVKTVVSLNSIMIDGTGMCGGCRVSVGGRPILPAWTGLNSTATRWISSSSWRGRGCIGTRRKTRWTNHPTPAESAFIRGSRSREEGVVP